MCNIAFLYIILGFSGSLAVICFFLILSYFAIVHLRRRPSQLRLGTWIAVIIVTFIWLRRYDVVSALPQLPFVYNTIGLSYILFRVLGLLIDIAQKSNETRLSFIDFVNYSCSLLSFVSGPIDRYDSFMTNGTLPTSLDRQAVQGSLLRITVGYFKVLVISAIAFVVFGNVKQQLFHTTGLIHNVLMYCTACSFYMIYLYYNFSGYMDIVIGIGCLAGMKLPENFDKPFSSASFLEFWSRWHITLSNWFKVYMFNPILQACLENWPSRAASLWLGVSTYFFVFLVMGLWHGSTYVFLIYGFFLGGAAAANKLWQALLTERLGAKRYRALAQSGAYRATGRGLTAGLFAVALTALWVNWGDLTALKAQVGIGGAVGAVVLISLVWAAISTVMEGAKVALTSTHRVAGVRTRLPAYISPSILIIVSAAVQSLLNKAPEFVYAGF